MKPERTKRIGGFVIEEFYWAGKFKVYVNDELTRDTFEAACNHIISRARAIVEQHEAAKKEEPTP